ncbi:type II toxin-antitoxin system RelE/ParE family toxin [Nitrobacter winogradskyi]|uniref:Plasmid maintenance system killer protein n=1 Tax=Nitrobacter winogradskyi TaxID=913 RepID=A0ACC6ANA1_NITWI|nr:plasmid maintenance system killer protein [Nitrobacter winogradskyi]
MNRPSFRLHPLRGNRKGQWAVTVRANWRIVFGFDGGNAIDVDFTDYH